LSRPHLSAKRAVLGHVLLAPGPLTSNRHMAARMCTNPARLRAWKMEQEVYGAHKGQRQLQRESITVARCTTERPHPGPVSSHLEVESSRRTAVSAASSRVLAVPAVHAWV
jgi:hypothetical protein